MMSNGNDDDKQPTIGPIHHGDAEIRLNDGTVLKLSRSYRDRFRRALGKTPS